MALPTSESNVSVAPPEDVDDVSVVASTTTPSVLPSAHFFKRKRQRQLGNGKVAIFEIVQKLSPKFFEANPTIIAGDKKSPNHVCTLCWKLIKVQLRLSTDRSKGFVNNIAKQHIMNKHPETRAAKMLSQQESYTHQSKVSAVGMFGVHNALNQLKKETKRAAKHAAVGDDNVATAKKQKLEGEVVKLQAFIDNCFSGDPVENALAAQAIWFCYCE
jgi:hypothetical protein